MRRRFRSALVVVLVALSMPVAGSRATAETLNPLDIAMRLAQLVPLRAADRPVAAGPRVAILSSGVDTNSLPAAVSTQITGAQSDAQGFGTYAASVVLQLAGDARITSLNVYGGSSVDPGALLSSLRWAASNASNLDAVLLAFPPGAYVDPISSSMQAGEWERLSAAITEVSAQGQRGRVFGVPMDGGMLWNQTKDAPAPQRALLYAFHDRVATWNAVRDGIRAIAAAGVGVVAPAGDAGPNLQTIPGVATLPDVETVGGFDETGPSAQSSSGPSIDGRVKPDVLAPTGLVGLVPDQSVLAQVLAANGLLDSSLQPAWSLGAPPTNSRTRLDTSLTSAAYVATLMAGMSAQGLRDVATQRAALAAASVPLAGVPVWRQGAGPLRMAPTASFASSRALVSGNGDLGTEPDAATWTAPLRVLGGAATGATTTITDFAGVGPDAKTFTTAAPSRPPVSASITQNGVLLALPVGDRSYSGGLYCGYTRIGLPTTGSDANTTVTAAGIPSGTEQVPTCLVKGTQLRALGFYIHDLPAENLTFGLLPAMPAQNSLLEKPLTMLPVDPLTTKLFFKVTGQDGNAYFSNVPPGYYTVRLFSDYGSPITQTFPGSATTPRAVVNSDIGEEVSYESFQALVLTPLCTDQVTNAAGEDLCSEAALDKQFGSNNVVFDPTTWTYLVTLAPGNQMRIVFDKLKKTPGPAVSSRYIDLLSYSDFTFATSQLTGGISLPALSNALNSPLLRTWSFTQGSSAPDTVSATYRSLLGATGGSQMGIAYYPFNLTTPNDKAHMALDLTYALKNATILAIVQMGNDTAAAAITPQSRLVLPPDSLGVSSLIQTLQLSGANNGKAHFDFHLMPKGASSGKLWLLYIPPANTLLASADVKNLSFELDTWTNQPWPPTTFPGPVALIGTNPLKPGVVAGHSFTVNPNFSAKQMSHVGCRALDQGGLAANVCEDWVVMVHSPGDDAAPFDVVDGTNGSSMQPALVAGGAGFLDPRRGVHDFTQVLSFAAPSLPVLEAAVQATNAFTTNGRFWEQLMLPMGFLAGHPGPVGVKIVDNVPGRSSELLGLTHSPGGVPVAPYVPLVADSMFLGM